jgi:hypothetical protein
MDHFPRLHSKKDLFFPLQEKINPLGKRYRVEFTLFDEKRQSLKRLAPLPLAPNWLSSEGKAQRSQARTQERRPQNHEALLSSWSGRVFFFLTPSVLFLAGEPDRVPGGPTSFGGNRLNSKENVFSRPMLSARVALGSGHGGQVFLGLTK